MKCASCGHATFKDFGMVADTGEYDGKPDEIADPCFVIRSPKGILLWDTGLGDKFAANKDGAEPEPGVHVTVAATLLDQPLGLAPADIIYVAFSHFHFDHTGNANEFPGSTSDGLQSAAEESRLSRLTIGHSSRPAACSACAADPDNAPQGACAKMFMVRLRTGSRSERCSDRENPIRGWRPGPACPAWQSERNR